VWPDRVLDGVVHYDYAAEPNTPRPPITTPSITTTVTPPNRLRRRSQPRPARPPLASESPTTRHRPSHGICHPPTPIRELASERRPPAIRSNDPARGLPTISAPSTGPAASVIMTCSWRSGRAAPRPGSSRRNRAGHGPADGETMRRGLRQSGCTPPRQDDGRWNRVGRGPADCEMTPPEIGLHGPGRRTVRWHASGDQGALPLPG
jgi:hypothetical protein